MNIVDKIKIDALLINAGLDPKEIYENKFKEKNTTILTAFISKDPGAFIESYYPELVEPTTLSYITDVFSQTKDQIINSSSALAKSAEWWRCNLYKTMKSNISKNADTISAEVIGVALSYAVLGKISIPATLIYIAGKGLVTSFSEQAPSADLAISKAEVDAYMAHLDENMINLQKLINNKVSHLLSPQEIKLEQLKNRYESATGVVLLSSAILRHMPIKISQHAHKLQQGGLNLCNIYYTAAKLSLGAINPMLAIGTIAQGLSDTFSLFGSSPVDMQKFYFDQLADKLDSIIGYLNAEIPEIRNQLHIIKKGVEDIQRTLENQELNSARKEQTAILSFFARSISEFHEKIKHDCYNENGLKTWLIEWVSHTQAKIKNDSFTGFYTGKTSLYEFSQRMNNIANVHNMLALIQLIENINIQQNNHDALLIKEAGNPHLSHPLLWSQAALCYLGAQYYIYNNSKVAISAPQNPSLEVLIEIGSGLNKMLKALFNTKARENALKNKYKEIAEAFSKKISTYDLAEVVKLGVEHQPCNKTDFFVLIWGRLMTGEVLALYQKLEILATFLRARALLEEWVNGGVSLTELTIGAIDSVPLQHSSSLEFHINVHNFSKIADIMFEVFAKNKAKNETSNDIYKQLMTYFNYLLQSSKSIEPALNPIEKTLELLFEYKGLNTVQKQKTFWNRSLINAPSVALRADDNNTSLSREQTLMRTSAEKWGVLSSGLIKQSDIKCIANKLVSLFNELKNCKHTSKTFGNGKAINSIKDRIATCEKEMKVIPPFNAVELKKLDILQRFSYVGCWVRNSLDPLKQAMHAIEKMKVYGERLGGSEHIYDAGNKKQILKIMAEIADLTQVLINKLSCTLLYAQMEGDFLRQLETSTKVEYSEQESSSQLIQTSRVALPSAQISDDPIKKSTILSEKPHAEEIHTSWFKDGSLDLVDQPRDVRLKEVPLMSDYELAQIVHATYSISEGRDGVLPSGWRVLRMYTPINCQDFGMVIYENSSNESASEDSSDRHAHTIPVNWVVVFRGREPNSVWNIFENIKSFFYSQSLSHFKNAQERSYLGFIGRNLSLALNDEILSNLSQGKVIDTIILSGHSLGATMAIIQALKQAKSSQASLIRSVVFDGPGVSPSVLSENEINWLNEKSAVSKKPNMTSYLTAPNMINTLHQHFGTVIRLYVPHRHWQGGFLGISDTTFHSPLAFLESRFYLGGINGLLALYENIVRAAAGITGVIATIGEKQTGGTRLLDAAWAWAVVAYGLSIPAVIVRNLSFNPAWMLNQHDLGNIVQCFDSTTHQPKVDNALNGREVSQWRGAYGNEMNHCRWPGFYSHNIGGRLSRFGLFPLPIVNSGRGFANIVSNEKAEASLEQLNSRVVYK